MYRVCVISIENRRVCPNAASLMIRNSQRGYHTDHLRARTSVSYRVAQRKMHCHLELFAVESCGFLQNSEKLTGNMENGQMLNIMIKYFFYLAATIKYTGDIFNAVMME